MKIILVVGRQTKGRVIYVFNFWSFSCLKSNYDGENTRQLKEQFPPKLGNLGNFEG